MTVYDHEIVTNWTKKTKIYIPTDMHATGHDFVVIGPVKTSNLRGGK